MQPGDLGSYTPSKIQMTEVPFQLGVSRMSQNESDVLNSKTTKPNSPNNEDSDLRPTENAVSWSGTSSADMLFWKKTLMLYEMLIHIS